HRDPGSEWRARDPAFGSLSGRGLALPRQPSGVADQAHEVVEGGRSRMRRKAVFLDRDGVIAIPEFRDGRSFAARRVADFRLYPEAAPSLHRLKRAGFVLAVVTNQPDVGHGLIGRSEVDEMHAIIAR